MGKQTDTNVMSVANVEIDTAENATYRVMTDKNGHIKAVVDRVAWCTDALDWLMSNMGGPGMLETSCAPTDSKLTNIGRAWLSCRLREP